MHGKFWTKNRQTEQTLFVTLLLCCFINHHTLKIASRTLYVCMLEFRRTLEIITRTLREVVNRVRLCGHHTQRCLRGEVHVYGAVVWRWGEGGDRCIDSVLRLLPFKGFEKLKISGKNFYFNNPASF